MSDLGLYEGGSTQDQQINSLRRLIAGLTKQQETQQSAGGSSAMAKTTDAISATIAALTKQLETLESACASSKQPPTADAVTESAPTADAVTELAPTADAVTHSMLGKRRVHSHETKDSDKAAAEEALPAAEDALQLHRSALVVLRDMWNGFRKKQKPEHALPVQTAPGPTQPAELAETKEQLDAAELAETKEQLHAANALLANDIHHFRAASHSCPTSACRKQSRCTCCNTAK